METEIMSHWHQWNALIKMAGNWLVVLPLSLPRPTLPRPIRYIAKMSIIEREKCAVLLSNSAFWLLWVGYSGTVHSVALHLSVNALKVANVCTQVCKLRHMARVLVSLLQLMAPASQPPSVFLSYVHSLLEVPFLGLCFVTPWQYGQNVYNFWYYIHIARHH